MNVDLLAERLTQRLIEELAKKDYCLIAPYRVNPNKYINWPDFEYNVEKLIDLLRHEREIKDFWERFKERYKCRNLILLCPPFCEVRILRDYSFADIPILELNGKYDLKNKYFVVTGYRFLNMDKSLKEKIKRDYNLDQILNY